MRKMSLTNGQAAFVERAAEWSRELTRLRARGPGDLENAMRAIERDYGIDYWLLWRLRYRLSQVNGIDAATYHQLRAVYFAEIERQQHRLAHQAEFWRAVVAESDDDPDEISPQPSDEESI